MRILLVNDDGYKADGINALDKILSECGHEIYMVAPSVEQSGKSHSMTLNEPGHIHRFADKHYNVDGTPVDCMIYSLKSTLLDKKPDLIVSGINHGYNQSTDIVYSGTCGAARQAVMYGYKAIAISADKSKDGKFNFIAAATFLAEHLLEFVSMIEEHSFLNINIPYDFNGKYEYSSIGMIEYDDQFSLDEVGDGEYVIKNTGCNIKYHSVDQNHPNDFELTSKGIAAISLVEISPTYRGGC